MDSGGYVVREIRLENVMSYERLQLTMSPGSMGIVGSNGAGKSTLLESLYAALTAGHTFRFTGDRGAHSLLRRNTEGGFIEVVLENGEGAQLIARVNLRRKGAEYVLKKKPPGGGQARLIATRREDYARALMEELGLSFPGRGGLRDFLSRAVIVPQGGLRQIAESMESPRKLREEIEVAIGLPEYRKAIEKLENLVVELEVEGERLAFKIGPRVLATVQENLRRERERSRELEEQLGMTRAVEEDLSRRLGEQRSRVEDLEERVQEARLRLRELEVLEQRLEDARRRLRDTEGKLAEARARLEEARRARDELERLLPLRGLLARLPEYEGARRLLLEKTLEKEEVEDLLSKTTRLLELEERTRGFQRLEEELEERQRELEEARERYARLRGLQDKVVEQVKRLGGELEELRRTLVNLASEAQPQVPPGAGEKGLLALLEERLEAQRRVYEEAQRRLSGLEALKRVRESSLKALRESEGDRCPLCGSPLDREHRERVERLLAEELARLERDIVEQRGLLEEAYSRMRSLEEALGEARRIVEELGRRGREKQELEEEERRLVREAGVWLEKTRRLEEEVARLKEAHRGLQALVWEKSQLSRELSRKGLEDPREALEALTRRRDALRREIEGLRERTAAFERELLRATGLGDLEEALKLLGGLGERIGRLTTLAQEEGGLETLVRELERERDEQVRIIAELEARVGERRTLVRRIEEMEKELARARSELESLEKEQKRLLEERNRLEALLGEAVRRKKILEKQESLIKAGLAAREALEWLMRSMYKRSLVRLEREMTRVLESFDLDPVRVEIQDEGGNPRLKVYTRSQAEVQVSQLSGGEKTALALAYVIALNTIMGARIGFLALDEPTSELDEERRKVLVRILSQLASPRGGTAPPVSQLLVVTHHNEVMDSVDTVCTVVKEGGRSHVSCGQPL